MYRNHRLPFFGAFSKNYYYNAGLVEKFRRQYTELLPASEITLVLSFKRIKRKQFRFND